MKRKIHFLPLFAFFLVLIFSGCAKQNTTEQASLPIEKTQEKPREESSNQKPSPKLSPKPSPKLSTKLSHDPTDKKNEKDETRKQQEGSRTQKTEKTSETSTSKNVSTMPPVKGSAVEEQEEDKSLDEIFDDYKQKAK